MREEIDFEYFKSIPIADVADVLGINVTRGKICCPSHDDNNPSADIASKNPKYINRWKCWACGEGGSTIDLVLAKKFNIKPSEYYNNKERYSKQLLETVRFLESYFPGGIKIMQDAENKDVPKPPNIPKEIITAIGLETNPLFDIKVTGPKKRSAEYKKRLKKIMGKSYGTSLDLLMSDRALILLDALQAYEASTWKYVNNVLDNFPKLDESARQIIINQAKEWIEEVHPYTEAVQQYYFKMSELEYESIDFEKEESLCFGEEKSESLQLNEPEREM